MKKAAKIKAQALYLKFLTLRPSLKLVFILLLFLFALCLHKSTLADFSTTAESYDVIDDPRAAVTADFNGDGFNDLAVVNYRVDKVSILLNKGDGTFLTAVNYVLIDSGPVALATEDFDGINGMDLAVANERTDKIDILLNNGDGTFTSAGTFTAGSGISSVVSYDFDVDGNKDLAVANSYNDTLGVHNDSISILIGNGDGTFVAPVNYNVGDTPIEIVGADFDGINGTDLAIANASSQNFSILLNNGDGTFAAAVNYTNNTILGNPASLATSDFDGDGDPDLAIVDLRFNGTSSIEIFSNIGAGVFNPVSINTYSIGGNNSFANSIVAGNFDSTAGIDLAVSVYKDNVISIFQGDGAGAFAYVHDLNTLPGPVDLVVADFDQDTKADLVSVDKSEEDPLSNFRSYSGNKISVFRSGVIITPTGGNTLVREGGATDTYDVVLASAPTANVTINIAYNAAQLSLDTNTLTFTTLNFATPQTVTITAVDDAIAEGQQISTITHTATSLDLDYNNSVMPDIDVTIADNDQAGVTIDQSGGSTPGKTEVREGVSADDSFSIVLETAPTDNVTVSMLASGQLSLGTTAVTFTPANWDVPRTVNVTAVTDRVIEGTVQENIVFTVTSVGVDYNGFLVSNIVVDIIDANILLNDPLCVGRTGDLNKDTFIDSLDYNFIREMISGNREASFCGELDFDGIIAPGDISDAGPYLANNHHPVNLAAVIVSESGGSTDVTEGGATDSYDVYLRQQPTNNVVINITPDAQLETDITQLTFTPLNYFAPQTVTVTAVDDFYVEASPHPGIISHTALSADLNYDALATPSVTANITDNDIAGVVLTESGGSTIVNETGPTSDGFDLRLTSMPTNNVTINLSTPDGQTTLLPTSLVFTALDWSIDQLVTVTAVDDAIFEDSPHTGRVWGTMTSLDPNYNGTGFLEVSILDNDTMPALTIHNASVGEGNSGTTNMDFNVTLSAASGATTNVDYATADGTATVADNDYVPVAVDLLIFNPGETSKTITILVNGDNSVEAAENFFVNLANPVNATIAVSQGVGTILNNDGGGGGSELQAPGDVVPPCEAVDLTENNATVKAINWKFHDNDISELGFRLYDDLGTMVKEVATPDINQIQETGLQVNKTYTRAVKSYNNAATSVASTAATCYTLANRPNYVQLSNITPDSITIKLDPNDGNPAATQYAIRVMSGTDTNFVNPDGSFSPTEAWHTYAEFGAANGVVVTGVTPPINTNVNAAFVHIALNSGQNYNFSAKARNGDNIETAYSDSSDSIPQPGNQPIITAVKGVAKNMAWNSSFGLFSTAWAGNNFVINLSSPLQDLIQALAWVLDVILLILLVVFALSLFQTLKYLKHEFKYPETFRLIWSILSKQAQHTYLKFALQTDEGVYHQSSYSRHKKLHNFSQQTFKGTLALAGLKLVVFVALALGIISLNHNGLAQMAPYNQNGAHVKVGDMLTYEVEVFNNGTAAAQNIIITDTLSNYLIFRSGSNDLNYDANTNTITYTIPSMAVNGWGNFLINAEVKAGSQEKIITNIASVSGDNFTTINTNITSNEVEPAVIVNTNVNQPPVPPTNQPPAAPVCGNGIIETGEACDISGCSTSEQCINCQCRPSFPSTNININQPPVVPPSGILPPIIGSLIEDITTNIINIVNNPEVINTSKNIVTPIIIAAAILNTLPAVIILTLYLLPYLHLIFLEPLLWLFRKKRNKWGMVYNSLTKLPVDLALVRLYNQATNKLVQTRVTDKKGRYLIIVAEPGKYLLSVTKPGFVSPSNYLKDVKQDLKYLDLYHGEVLEVTEKNAVLTANIPVDPVDQKALPLADIVRNYALKNLRLIISFIGMFLALIVVLIVPTMITVGALIVHVLLYLALRRFIVPSKPKSWGVIYDNNTKAPLATTVMRIFDTRFNKLLETQLTDRQGRYAFLVGQNEYQLLAEKAGYQNREVKPVDLVKNEEIVNLDIGLNKI